MLFSGRAQGAAYFATAHHAIGSARADAQRSFDEGLTLYYAYAPQDAVARFRNAANADARSAMAHYGMALAYGPNINEPYDLEQAARARAELERAHALSAQASVENRALIAALDLRYAATTETAIAPAQLTYARAMDALAETYDRDADVQALAADAWLDTQPWGYWEHGKALGHTLRILALLDRALAIDPDHIGANHFKIHALEESDRPGDALQSGRRLAAMSLAPGCEHLVHMPAHVDVRTGHWDDAIRASEEAIAHFHAYLARAHAAGHEGYLRHDTGMLLYAGIMAGDYDRALAIARRVSRENAQFAGAEFAVYERYERWSEILALPLRAVGALSRSARGEAFAVLGKREEAQRIADALAADVKRRPSDGTARIEQLLVASRIAEAAGEQQRAIRNLEAAVVAQDEMGYMEPPAFPFPVRERLGELLLGLGRIAEARRVFAADLVRTPGNTRSIAGITAIDAGPPLPVPSSASADPSPIASASPAPP